MLWNQIKANRKVITGLLLTTFVTACVKNGSKDTNPGVVQLKTLETTELTTDQLEGASSIQLLDDSDKATINIVKEYSFMETGIREFQISQGDIKNSNCIDKGPFVYSFKLIDQNGVSKDIHSKRNPEMLTPGPYKVRVEIENGSLCSNISMELKIRSKVREDLVLTDIEDRSYSCRDSVIENGSLQNNTIVLVKTLLMNVLKLELDIRASKLADEQNLCDKPLDPKTTCTDGLIPALKSDEPIAAIEKKCKNEGQRYDRAQAQLQVNKVGQKTDINFTCRHKGKVTSLKLENCTLVYNIGKDLPIRIGQTDVVVRPNRMHVSFEPIFNEINKTQLPFEMYVGLARNVMGRFIPLSNSFHLISRDDLFDGQIRIENETALKNKFKDMSGDDIRLVFSRRPDLKHGLFNLSFKKLCSHEGNSVMLKTNAGKEDLCE